MACSAAANIFNPVILLICRNAEWALAVIWIVRLMSFAIAR